MTEHIVAKYVMTGYFPRAVGMVLMGKGMWDV